MIDVATDLSARITRIGDLRRSHALQLAEILGVVEYLHLKVEQSMKTQAEIDAQEAALKTALEAALASKDAAIAAQKTTIDGLNTLNAQLQAQIASGGTIDTDKMFNDLQALIDEANAAVAATAPASPAIPAGQ